MKKIALVLITFVLCLAACCALAAEAPFTPGEEATEYTVEGSSGWNTVNAYVLITAGEDTLYNGKVTVTSDQLLVSEFTYAAITEAGCGCDGVLEGFVNSIGDYASGNDADGNYVFWGYTVNGKYVPFACNQMPVLEGDYIWWDFQVYNAEAGIGGEALPCGYDAPFEVGEETTEYTVDGASGWTSGTVNMKIMAGDDILYNGTVALTSDNMFVSEATYAAIAEAGCGSDGVLEGFVNSIGDYASGNDADGNYIYWGYTVNGKYVPFGCNQMPLLNNDYVLWTLQTYAAQ